jgi:glycosyltransferase involved in cell wall biosynthesis
MTKNKVLILTNTILHYRYDLYNNLAKNVDLTIATVNESIVYHEAAFNQISFLSKKTGPFYIQKDLYKLCKEFDVVIIMFNITYISFMKLLFQKRNFQIILWGIGVSTENGFDKNSSIIKERIRYYLAKKADAIMFYSEYPLKKYIQKGINSNKLFVAHNTIANDYIFDNSKIRSSFLFLGSLHKRKKIFILLQAFKNVVNKIPKEISIDIIGKGEEYRNIENWIIKNNLQDRIILHGQKTKKDLICYFEKAIACISPGQAGLSVLESFSYGVPFITHCDAITGGERLDIKHGCNGFLFEDENQLESLIIELSKSCKATTYHHNAYEYYKGSRKITDMSNSITNAIESVSNNINYKH